MEGSQGIYFDVLELDRARWIIASPAHRALTSLILSFYVGNISDKRGCDAPCVRDILMLNMNLIDPDVVVRSFRVRSGKEISQGRNKKNSPVKNKRTVAGHYHSGSYRLKKYLFKKRVFFSLLWDFLPDMTPHHFRSVNWQTRPLGLTQTPNLKGATAD